MAMNFKDHKEVSAALTAHQEESWELREHAQENHNFINLPNGQWEIGVWNNNAGNPRYTYDITTPIVDQAAHDIAEADYSIRVLAGDERASEETAEVFDGIIRKIQNASGAKHIMSRAGRDMFIGGISGWRVVSKYADEASFDQDLFIEPVHDLVNRVWIDMAAKDPNGADARFAFVLHFILKEDYEERWPEGKCSSLSMPPTSNNEPAKDVVVVCEFLWGQQKKYEVVEMSNGMVFEVDDDFKKVEDDFAAAGIKIARSKKAKGTRWFSRFFDAADWLEKEQEMPFKSCPVVVEYGNHTLIEGKTYFRGEVSRILDPARNLNYVLSRQVAEGALAPRAKYWMTKAQMADPEVRADLATLNTNNKPVQTYVNDSTVPGPPQQQGGAQLNQGLQVLAESMVAIVSKISSRHEAAMGENPALQSGVAISQLLSRSDLSGFKYLQWHAQAIERTGKILTESIPIVLDKTSRDYRTESEDGTHKFITLNKPVVDEQTRQVIKLNDLSVGSYSVTCEAGASFKNRQDQARAFLLELGARDPETLALGGDLLLRTFNFPASRTLADRKRSKMVDQGLIPADQLSDEEKQKTQDRSQNQPQDPAMVLAMAEMKKAEAELMRAQLESQKLQLLQMELQAKLADNGQKNAIAAGNLDVNEFNAETKRLEAQSKAAESAKITDLKLEGSALDNAAKIKQLMSQPYNETNSFKTYPKL
jgi:hypothetical protein